jgi:hypothetical protein
VHRETENGGLKPDGNCKKNEIKSGRRGKRKD